MKQFFRGGLVVCSIFAIVFSGLPISHTAKAAGATNLTMYWSDSDANDLKGKFNDGKKWRELEGKISVVAQGGVFGDGYVLQFSSAINDQLSNNESLVGTPDDSGEYYAVAPLYCSKEGAVSLEAPSEKPYFAIDYVLGYKFDNWDAVSNGDNYPTYAGITKITKKDTGGRGDSVVHLKGSNTGPNNLADKDRNASHHNSGGDGGSGDDIDKVGVPGSCLNEIQRGKPLGTKTRNYYKLSDTEKTAIDDIVAGAPTTGTGSGTPSTGTNCQGGPMGWLFCPLVNAMAKTVQTAAGLIEKLMEVRFLAATGSGSEIEKAWRAILSLANLLLVVAFLFIILSQATSMGLSNYNVKKMLPRLVVAAILMNLSFYICAFAIDMSNIAGGSIMGFMLGSGNTISSSITNATGGDGDFISGAIAGIALIALAFFIFVPVVLSIVVIFIVLIARQVILMVLVLLSPLAFVAWLLPNTERHFKRWSELFTQMLVIYPMVMFMFGASLYLANLIGSPGAASSIIGG